MDPIIDIFRTMHVTAFGLHRLEATAPWGVEQDEQTEQKVTLPDKKNVTHRFGALRHAFARQLFFLLAQGDFDKFVRQPGNTCLMRLFSVGADLVRVVATGGI